MKAQPNESIRIYTDAFEARYADLSADRLLERDLRLRSMDRFSERGFDTRGREDWKYGDITPMAGGGFLPVESGDDTIDRFEDLLVSYRAHRLVFLNGRYLPARSRLEDLPDGVTLKPLAEAGDLPALGSVTESSDATFTTLNGAFWTDGLIMELAPDVTLDRPVELVFITDSAADTGLVTPRNLIIAGAGSRALIIEHFVGPNDVSSLDTLLNVPLTEVICAENAQISHYKIMRENAKSLHTGSTHVRQAEGSRYLSREIVLGGGTTRRELHVDLVGAGAACDINALYMGGGQQRLDMRTRVRHSAAGCETREVYKSILDGNAKAVFDGLIHVARDAQQTSAHQTNRNLLISDTATAYSIPRLEIYADDVKCSHGSTTGELDDDQLFYLRSRGFDYEAARMMLAGAFAGEVLQDLEPAELREALGSEVAGRLALANGLGKSGGGSE